MTLQKEGAPTSSLLADDDSVIDQLVAQLTDATKSLPGGYKLSPITFEKVGRRRGAGRLLGWLGAAGVARVTRARTLRRAQDSSRTHAPTCRPTPQDDDTNYHMDMIAGLANMRARNYSIPEVCTHPRARCAASSVGHSPAGHLPTHDGRPAPPRSHAHLPPPSHATLPRHPF